MTRLDFPDIAVWQGKVDVAVLAQEIRTTSILPTICYQAGITNEKGQRDRNEYAIDGMYARNRDLFTQIAPDLLQIIYYFPIVAPRAEQVAWYKRVVGALPKTATGMVDIEGNVKANGFDETVALVRELSDVYQRKFFWYGGGYYPLEPSWIEDDRVADIPKIFAAYSSLPDMLTKHAKNVEAITAWQYTNKLRFRGVWEGQVDTDGNCILNLDLFKSCFPCFTEVKPPVEPTIPTIPEMSWP